MEAEAALVVRRCGLLLGVDLDQGRVDVQDHVLQRLARGQRRRQPRAGDVGSCQPGTFPRCGTGSPELVQPGLVDAGQDPPRGRG